MENKSVKDTLKDLHERCVITPIDKTNGSVALICKNFYELTLFRELGIANSQSANTYEYCKNTQLNLYKTDTFASTKSVRYVRVSAT